MNIPPEYVYTYAQAAYEAWVDEHRFEMGVITLSWERLSTEDKLRWVNIVKKVIDLINVDMTETQ